MRVPEIQNTGTPNAGEDEARQGPPLAAGGNAGGAAASEDGLDGSLQSQTLLPRDAAITLLVFTQGS